MQFSLNLDLVKLGEWNINTMQGCLVSFLTQAASWAKPIVIDSKVWYWCSKTKILEELGTVFKTKDTIYRNLKTLQEKGIINYKKVNGMDLFSLTQKARQWLKKDTDVNGEEYFGDMEKNLPNTRKKSLRNSVKIPKKLGKNSNISYKPNYKTKITPPTPQGGTGVCTDFEKIWETYTSNAKAKKTGKTAAEKQFKKLKLDGGEVKQILNAIQSHWENDSSWKRGYQPELKNFLRDERWKDKIVVDKPTQSRNSECLTAEQEAQREKERNDRELQEATSYVRDFESKNNVTESTFATLHKGKTLLAHKYLMSLSRVNREKYLKLSKALKNDASTNS